MIGPGVGATGANTTDADTVGANFLRLGSGEAVARLVAFGVAVYLARTLGSSTYGMIVLAATVLLYLGVFTDCGVGFLGVRVIAESRQPAAETVRTVLGARLLVAMVGIALATGVAWATLPVREATIIIAYSLILFTVALNTRWVHVGLGRSGSASIGRVVAEAVTAVAVVTLVRRPADLGLVPVAQFAGEAVGALILVRSLPVALQSVRVALRPVVVRDLLSQSWPLVVHALLGLVIFNSDLVFLRAFRDSASVGAYAASYALISFCLNLGSAYTMSLLPVITRVRDDRQASRFLYDHSMARAVAGTFPLAVGGFLVAAPLILLVYGTEYASAALPLSILVWSLPVALIRNVSQAAMLAYGRQREMMHTAAWAAGANVVLNILLIPRWGLAGAAAATLVTEMIRTALALIVVHRIGIPMTSPVRFVRIALAVCCMGVVVLTLDRWGVVVTIALGAIGYVTALTALGAIRFRRGLMPELRL